MNQRTEVERGAEYCLVLIDLNSHEKLSKISFSARCSMRLDYKITENGVRNEHSLNNLRRVNTILEVKKKIKVLLFKLKIFFINFGNT